MQHSNRHRHKRFKAPRRRDRRKQWRLRKTSLKLANNKCIVSGYTNPCELQAAHIVPRAVGLKFNFRYVDSPRNVISLNSGLHLLFDKFQWTFDVFRFIDTDKEDDDYVTMTILPASPAHIGVSSLNGLRKKRVRIHRRYFPMLYLHYQVFLFYNFTDRENMSDIDFASYYFQAFSVKNFFKSMLEARSVKDCKKICMDYREKENLQYSVIAGHRTGPDGKIQFLTAWDYYPYDSWTWEAEENIDGPALQAYKSWKIMS
jgi:hypothetical protein